MITSVTTTTTLMSAPSSSSLFLTRQKKTTTPTDVQPVASPSTLDAFHNWCVMQEEAATVLCFVRDIHAMSQTMVKDKNFFWIGKVPCRRVNFVGMVVGIQNTGLRIKISVDDGTAVIDCAPSSVVAPTPASSSSSSSKSTSLPTRSTTIRIGHIVRVIGKIEERHDIKEIRFDSVEQCESFNDEPRHWQKVSSLHKTYYSSPGPFVIPNATHQTQNQDFIARVSQASIDVEPFSIQEPPLSQSPQKFTHPSRLRSTQLTDNTFRLYLKHYMENPPHTSSHTVDMSDTDTELDATPRPRNHRLRMPSDMHGFTLSFLRRIPELSDMAKLVVNANIKRLRRKEREAAKASPQSLRKSQKSSRKPLGPKKKQLFINALVDLMKEGSIVLWDGPKHPLSTASLPGPWKSTSTQYTPASIDTFSTTTSTFMTILQDDDDDDPLSDPEPVEESYVPLTPQYTADVVENAMAKMNALPLERRRPLHNKRITEFLRRTDDRWRNLGDWAVRDALELLRTEKRVRLNGPKGPWELCS
ncbi:hypothetical protein F5146DRAFT_520108 [Armillaria mellea]|nr:hypothetical protein F5146DRAFT_520108 [Armillaria mellea]